MRYGNSRFSTVNHLTTERSASRCLPESARFPLTPTVSVRLCTAQGPPARSPQCSPPTTVVCRLKVPANYAAATGFHRACTSARARRRRHACPGAGLPSAAGAAGPEPLRRARVSSPSEVMAGHSRPRRATMGPNGRSAGRPVGGDGEGGGRVTWRILEELWCDVVLFCG